jgi:hypothetical protein
MTLGDKKHNSGKTVIKKAVQRGIGRDEQSVKIYRHENSNNELI